MVYHVLNRANRKHRIFFSDGDYRAFEEVLEEACARTGTRLVSYCVMPNHWHLVVWPRTDGELSVFVGWLAMTHVQRWHAFRRTVGTGHLYQGRFRSFPIQNDEHLLTVCRYVERNPLSAGLVARAEAWPWSSLPRLGRSDALALSEWPVARPSDWVNWVNLPLTSTEREAVQTSIRRGRPFGAVDWQRGTAARLGLESTLNRRGRPAQKGS